MTLPGQRSRHLDVAKLRPATQDHHQKKGSYFDEIKSYGLIEEGSSEILKPFYTESPTAAGKESEIACQFFKTMRREPTRVKSEVKLRACPLPNACRESEVLSTVAPTRRPHSALGSRNEAVLYACDPCDLQPRPQSRQQFPVYPDDGFSCIEPNKCDCGLKNCMQIPQNRATPICPGQRYGDPYVDEAKCEWCWREEQRRRFDRKRYEPEQLSYCPCGLGLQTVQYPPTSRPASRWRPPSRFAPRAERCCEPFIPYSHRSNSRYHRHCLEPAARESAGRGPVGRGAGGPPAGAWRRTVPSARCAAPPPCCRDLPVLRRSTIPSRTTLCSYGNCPNPDRANVDRANAFR